MLRIKNSQKIYIKALEQFKKKFHIKNWTFVSYMTKFDHDTAHPILITKDMIKGHGM